MSTTGTQISTDPADLLASIQRGLDDVAAGRVVSLDHLLDEEDDD